MCMPPLDCSVGAERQLPPFQTLGPHDNHPQQPRRHQYTFFPTLTCDWGLPSLSSFSALPNLEHYPGSLPSWPGQ